MQPANKSSSLALPLKFDRFFPPQNIFKSSRGLARTTTAGGLTSGHHVCVAWLVRGHQQ